MCVVKHRGAIGGKTGKTTVLPSFCKIEHDGGSGGAPLCYGGLSLPGRARRAGGAPGCVVHNWGGLEIKFTIEKCASLMNLHNLDHVRHRHTYGVIYYTNRNLALHHSAASDDK